MGIAERRYQRETAGEGVLRNPFSGEKTVVTLVATNEAPEESVWGVRCRSDVNGNPKNLNIERNFRPRADRRHDGTETAKISIATCETIARSYGVARLCAKTRRNFEKLCLSHGEPFAISKLREWGDRGILR